MIGVFGEVMIELCPTGNGLLRPDVAGDTYNTSVMLAHLGCQVSYFSALGDDTYSQKIRETMDRHTVDDSFTLCLEGTQPGIYAIANQDNGERSFTYWRDTSAAKQLFSQPGHFSGLLKKAEACSAIYWSGITLALMSEENRQQWFEFLTAFRNQGRLVFFDTNYRELLWGRGDNSSLHNKETWYEQAAQHCDYFLPSLEDVKAIWSLTTTEQALEQCNALGCANVVMTGERKVYLLQAGKSGSIDLDFFECVVDATGAGDAFSGAFVATMLSGAKVEKAIKVAHIAASHVVQHPGAILPDEKWPTLQHKLAEVCA